MWPKTVQSDTVQRAFVEWTKGLSDIDARISIFNQIRDIPYAVIPEINNPVDGPEGLLKRMRGSCAPKHFLLGRMFEILRIPTKYVTYPFSWNIKSVVYPPELRKLAEAVPIAYHLAVHARIGDQWVVVDATWDRPLARVGFPFNESWDGVSDTKLAVEPLDDSPHKDAQERMRFVKARKYSWTADDHARTDRFASALNNWLEDVRRNPSS
jgi:transglutaminase-like putative cysteine protease